MQSVILKSRLLRLYDHFAAEGDAASARKVRQLAEKLVRGEFGVATDEREPRLRQAR